MRPYIGITILKFLRIVYFSYNIKVMTQGYFSKLKNYITNIFPSFNREPMVTNWRWSADSYHWRYDQGARRQQKEALGYQIQDILQQRYTEMVSIQGCPQRWPSGKFTHQLCCDALRVFWFQLRTLRVDYCDHAGACYEVLW